MCVCLFMLVSLLLWILVFYLYMYMFVLLVYYIPKISDVSMTIPPTFPIDPRPWRSLFAPGFTSLQRSVFETLTASRLTMKAAGHNAPEYDYG